MSGNGSDGSRLYDTSALVAHLLDGDVGKLFDEHALDLTFYEAGNAVWKTARLRDEMDAEGCERAVELLGKLGDEMVVHTFDQVSLGGVMGIAVEDDLTFYDASYVEVAEAESLRLVTLDNELYQKASERVGVEKPEP